MTRLRRTVVPPAGHWLRDAWVTGADAVIATALVVSGLFTHIRWLAALAGLWAVRPVSSPWMRNPMARVTAPAAASATKWLAVARMTVKVASGYTAPSTRTQIRRARNATVRPLQADQTMWTEGIAAYWLDSDATSPEAHEPNGCGAQRRCR
jgi:hypothetical protein